MIAPTDADLYVRGNDTLPATWAEYALRARSRGTAPRRRGDGRVPERAY